MAKVWKNGRLMSKTEAAQIEAIERRNTRFRIYVDGRFWEASATKRLADLAAEAARNGWAKGKKVEVRDDYKEE